jgi:hypothetical protein
MITSACALVSDSKWAVLCCVVLLCILEAAFVSDFAALCYSSIDPEAVSPNTFAQLNSILTLHLTLSRPLCDTLRARRCGCDDGKADVISTLLVDAKALVQRARDSAGGETCKGPMLTADEANAQVLYETVALWERHVEVLMGLVVVSADGTVKATDAGRLSYMDGTVAFGRHVDAKWYFVVKSLKPWFQSLAMARHWYADPVRCHCITPQCCFHSYA